MASSRGFGLATPLTAVSTETIDNNTINNLQFFNDLTRLKELRSFLIQEAVKLDNPSALQFGPLDLLQCSAKGRTPTREEWEQLESRTQLLFGTLTEPLRRRFLFGRIPMSVAILPAWLLLAAMLALVAAIIATVQVARLVTGNLEPTFYLDRFTLPIYLVWLMLLGALGSMAFVGMNALSLQHDITFDLTNRKLMWLRVTLGALFAVILTLPFGGFEAFTTFIETLLFRRSTFETGGGASVGKQGFLLVLPFVLGFSTPLVITILNRFVESAQTFFGQTGGGEVSGASPTSPQTQPLTPTAVCKE